LLRKPPQPFGLAAKTANCRVAQDKPIVALLAYFLSLHLTLFAANARVLYVPDNPVFAYFLTDCKK
jgi:hypothetical protein